jgi:hypothetical protein
MKTDQSGAQFEISIDGKPRTMADQAADVLRLSHPNNDVVVRDLRARPNDPIPLRPLGASPTIVKPLDDGKGL